MLPPLLLLVVGGLLLGCAQDEPTDPPASVPTTGPGETGAPAPEAASGAPERTGATPASAPDSPKAPSAAELDLPGLWFTDQTAAAGVAFLNVNGSERDTKRAILESIGQGSAWLDDDLDGHLDLYVANGWTLGELPEAAPTSRFFVNNGDGTFRDASEESGLASTAWNNGVAAADFDGDGDTDLFVANWGPHSLYVNDGAGRFVDEAAARGVVVEGFELTPWGACAAWGDVNLDGHLDLYVGHYLGFDPENPPHGGETQNWKGMRDAYYGPTGLPTQRDFLFVARGDGTFRDGSEPAGIAASEAAYTLGAVFVDVNADGNPDLYVANDSQPNYLYVGDGTGAMRERGALSGLAYGEHGNAQAGMGVDAADYDADGDLDLVVTNFDDDVNTLYRNQHVEGGRSFRDVTVALGLAGPTRNVLSWGVGFHDFDLDADLDLFIACGHVYPSAETDDPNTKYRQANQLYVQDRGRLRLVKDAGPGAAVRAVSRGTAFGDYDADGDVDVFVNNLNEAGTLMRNDTERTADAGAWLAVMLVGAGPEGALAGSKRPANRAGIGARVQVRATVHGEERLQTAERAAGQSFLSTNSPWLHFGLGDAARAEEVRVTWPGGHYEVFGPLPANARHVLKQGTGRSTD